MSYSDDEIHALAWMRTHMAGEMKEMFGLLDNSGIFREMDEQTGYENPRAILNARLAASEEMRRQMARMHLSDPSYRAPGDSERGR